MSATRHPLDGQRRWGIISFYLLPFVQNRLPPTPRIRAYRIAAWARFVGLARRITSNNVLNILTSLPILIACWIDGLISLFGLLLDPKQHLMWRFFLGFLIIFGMIEVNAFVIQCFSNNYCSNWYMYQFVRWLKNSVVHKRVRPWTVSNFLMNISILLLALSSVRVFFWFGALSISLVATISLVLGRNDDMGVLDGLQTCYYMSTLTLFTTKKHGVLVSLVSLIVLLFLVLCTVGVAPDDSDSEDGRHERGPPKKAKYVCGQYQLRGFPNKKRTCFFNAIMQILLSIHPLRHRLMKVNHFGGPLTKALKQLFIDTSITSHSDYKKSLKNLFNLFCAQAQGFIVGQDQDSQECLVMFLQQLKTEEEKVLALTYPDSPPLFVEPIFGGLEMITTSCRRCQYTNPKPETFLQLLIEIPESTSVSRHVGVSTRIYLVDEMGEPVSLNTCLAHYAKLEVVSDWKCDACKLAEAHKPESLRVNMGGHRRSLITVAPLVLTICLSRFRKDITKIQGHILFEESLDLSPYIHMDQRFVDRKDKFEYHLIGAVEHVGDMNAGHYTAYVRGDRSGGTKEDDKGVWYCVSDSVVRETSLLEVLQSEPYILFYAKSCEYGVTDAGVGISKITVPLTKPSRSTISADIGLVNSSPSSIPQVRSVDPAGGSSTFHSKSNPFSKPVSASLSHRHSTSSFGSGKGNSSKKPSISRNKSMEFNWRFEGPKGNGGPRWKSDDEDSDDEQR